MVNHYHNQNHSCSVNNPSLLHSPKLEQIKASEYNKHIPFHPSEILQIRATDSSHSDSIRIEKEAYLAINQRMEPCRPKLGKHLHLPLDKKNHPLIWRASNTDRDEVRQTSMARLGFRVRSANEHRCNAAWMQLSRYIRMYRSVCDHDASRLQTWKSVT